MRPGVRGYTLYACAYLGNSRFYGENSYKGNAKSQRIKNGNVISSTHAELAALLKMRRHLRERATLYVWRLRADGELTMAKPCGDCMKQFESFKVPLSRVHYTNYAGEWCNLGKELR